MPKIPAPEELAKIAQSVYNVVEDREWKKYQRYLKEFKQKYRKPNTTEQPITFEKYCATL
jgi:hypothetical protein